MKTSEVRQSFIDYFKSRGHTHVRSASLVPAADPTLLFTNAGMVQFKQVFQGLEKRDYSRAVTVQKCVRAGGKHNDLEQVGHTARHHTFFEMLGNFSFGDYFKRDAIQFGWEWVTSSEYLGIDPDRLYVSVHHTDDEARRLWHELTGISKDRIYGLGDRDNFWQMADTGPCGPCSEIFVDIRHLTMADGQTGGDARIPTLDEFIDLNEEGHLLEIWNLVFMQFDQTADGSRTPLPAPSVDTGAGAERIAAVMQDVPSNFDSQLFLEIIKCGEDVIGKKYDIGPEGAGFRVLADHARAVAFLLADGVYPSNDGRGYVLRRILRRGLRHAYLLGRSEPTLVHMADSVVQLMGDSYPELREKAAHIEKVTRAEEERFLETIEGGLRRLDEITVGTSGTLSGEEAFKLYDTYGFPVDLTQIIAEERGWSVDQAGFETALRQQQARSRAAQGSGGGSSASPPARPSARGAGKGFIRVTPRVRQKFVGYETTRAETDIIAFRLADHRMALILKENPFYAESGGQVSDTGVVKGDSWTLEVDDVHVEGGKHVVVGNLEGEFEPTRVDAVVDESRRHDIMRNHTATHLAHAALRKVLGDHVRQAGSVVAPDRLRFDFSHHSPVKPGELAEIEEEVNRGIWQNEDVGTQIMGYDDALSAGAMALFGEKYADRVRCVCVQGISLELCGGTHVRTTGQIGLFHITGETGIAAGVRRIEAVTGPGAYRHMKGLESHLGNAAEKLRTGPEHVPNKVEALIEEKKKLEKQVEELIRSGSSGSGGSEEIHAIGDVTVVVDESPVSDRAQAGLLMDAFRDKNRNGIKVVFTSGERPSIFIAVTDDLVSNGVKAGELANRLAEISGGRGGGRPHFASSGIGDADKVSETKEMLSEIVRGYLKECGVAGA